MKGIATLMRDILCCNNCFKRSFNLTNLRLVKFIYKGQKRIKREFSIESMAKTIRFINFFLKENVNRDTHEDFRFSS